MTQKTSVLFVCTGNIVRSPLAEHMFFKLARDAGVAGQFLVDSAGTTSYHVGEQPDHRMRQVAAEYGLDYTGRSRLFTRRDFDEFDLIIVMDRSNRSSLERLARGDADLEKIHMLREFDPQGGPNADVPDPYYGGINGFHEAYHLVERSTQNLLQAILDGNV